MQKNLSGLAASSRCVHGHSEGELGFNSALFFIRKPN